MAETKRTTAERVVNFLLEEEGVDFLRESLRWKPRTSSKQLPLTSARSRRQETPLAGRPKPHNAVRIDELQRLSPRDAEVLELAQGKAASPLGLAVEAQVWEAFEKGGDSDLAV